MVRCIATARVIMPRTVVRLSAGRMNFSLADQVRGWGGAGRGSGLCGAGQGGPGQGGVGYLRSGRGASCCWLLL